MKSKTIILSSPDGKTSGRGILSIFEEDGLLQCRLRLYNIEKLNKYCKIGVYHNNEVSSANLLEKAGVYTSSLVGNFDIDKDFYTAIIDTSNNNDVVISGGTYAGFFSNDDSVFEKKFSRIEKENPETDLLEYDINYQSDCSNSEHSESLKTHGENSKYEEHVEDSCNKCLHCKYKEYFYAHTEHEIEDDHFPSECNNAESKKFTNSKNHCDYGMFRQAQHDTLCHSDRATASGANLDNEFTHRASECSKAESKNPLNEVNTAMEGETNELVQDDSSSDPSTPLKMTETPLKITDSLVQQFQYVFENYQADETLNKLIPNSKFVKIEEKNPQLLETQEQYSIGAIYEEDEMRYICYAVMCNYNQPAPKELGEHYQWLPLDKEDPLSEGYYIVFQDAQDLKIVDL